MLASHCCRLRRAPINSTPCQATTGIWLSLSTLVMLIAIAAVVVLVDRARLQRAAVNRVHDLGGWYMYEHLLEEPAEPPGPGWLREISGDEYFLKVVGVSLSDTRVGDDDLALLAGLPGLKHLWLDNTSISDRSLRYIGWLPHLEELSIRGCRISKVGTAKLLRTSPNLRIHR